MGPDVKSNPDLFLILDCAAKCWNPDGSLATDHYLCILHELRKLLHLFHGSLPVIYNSGLSPLTSLEIHRVSGAGCYYRNLHMMVDYETNNKLLKGSSRLCSGTVAVQDLNRILKFLLDFLHTLHQRELDRKSFPAKERVEIYVNSLGLHHSALKRLSCKIAVSRCPGRRSMMKKLSSCCHGDAKPITVLDKIVGELRLIETSVDRLLLQVDNIFV